MSKNLIVPAEILRSFKKVFPKIETSLVSWSWEVPHKIYEASFEQQGISYEVEITVTGHHLLTEIYIPVPALPDGILPHIKEAFPNDEVVAVERITYSNGDVHYEVELNGPDGERELLVREDGLILASGDDL